MLIDHRIWRAWDFSPLYGLVICGGAGYPVSNQVWGYLTDVEISTNYAIDFNSLPSLPQGITMSCLVIVGSDKIFHIGGWTGMTIKHNLMRYLLNQKPNLQGLLM